MSLPKEPRQKMINLMYLVLTALLAMNVSSEILNAFKVVDGSLKNSNNNIEKANGTLYASLDEKLKDPQSSEKAKIWQPMALKAKELSADMFKYLEDLKQELKKESDLRMIDGKESFKEDNLDAASRMFDTNGKGKELEARLKAYKEAMLNIDPAIRKEFESTLPVEVEPPVAQDGSKKDFTTSFFHMTPSIAALTILSKFENNIKNSENQVVTFCHNQIGAVKVIFNKFQPIAAGSSTYLMPGQEMTVTAGVGAFNDQSKPEISIGGSAVSLNENGVAEKKFNVSGTGNQKVHVSINYTKPDGTKDHLEKDIDYTVGIPGGAAIMLDKMNVFYIGVDNPITISSGSGWDKTQVTPTGCTLSGSAGSRIVRVTSVGTASINVTADGKSVNFPFRVKRIPDPIIKVGPSTGGKMQAVVFRAQQYVSAVLENFDFAANYSVKGAKVYFNIPGNRNVTSVDLSSGSLAPAAQYMSQCVPGTIVTFDNIKVVGPDGESRTIQNPPYFQLF